MLVGLIVVEPVYDDFSKPRRPRYTEHKETMAFGSIPIVIYKTLEVEIKLNYEQVLAAEDEELKKIVASEVLNTLRSLKMPKKVTDFDKDRFVADIDGLFHQMFLKWKCIYRGRNWKGKMDLEFFSYFCGNYHLLREEYA